ncbi:hypothetical protein NNC19_01760 [Clostridium sp. SHJSY1]|uniref:hypothetical protein n=1 Tax=Clostridium sp. SHJSY1 TaxID=2942483 RepID=UPI00287622F7|nr:hypothetical protein [Clostridium sp. SHJSY1]MDS0524384.1 hypothetical protein [Clostridium sp. SHJSY1]
MTKKNILLYILCGICFVMPIISVEGLIPWVIAIFLISKNFKKFKENNSIKPVVLNTIYCMGLIFIYNILARNIEKILVKMFM